MARTPSKTDELLSSVEDMVFMASSPSTLKFKENPKLRSCWEEHGCTKKSCTAYGSTGVRCWHQLSARCFRGKKLKSLSEKWKTCRTCEVFLQSTETEESRLAEFYNNVVFLLHQLAPNAASTIGVKSDCHVVAAEAGLTPRETEIYCLLAQKLTKHDIAEALGVSENTVRTHAKTIYRKLGVHSKSGLIPLRRSRTG